jgi:hypothetical protein
VELKPRTKLVGGVLALALAALIVDRMVGPGPASAEAAPASDQGAAQAAPVREPPRKQAPIEPAHHGALGARLDELASAEAAPTKDAFIAPVAWFPPDPAPEQVQLVDKPREEPKRRLTSVVGDGSRAGKAAVIDGKLFKVGSPVMVEGSDGRKYRYELVRAWFEGNVGRAQVRINGKLVELVACKEEDKAAGDAGGTRP